MVLKCRRKKSKIKEDTSAGKVFYKGNKASNPNKNMITKHADHYSKEQKKKLPSFIDFLKHIAENQSEEHVKEEHVFMESILDKFVL